MLLLVDNERRFNRETLGHWWRWVRLASVWRVLEASECAGSATEHDPMSAFGSCLVGRARAGRVLYRRHQQG